MALITVLIPLYNGIEFLNEALDSVLSQTFNDYTVLIGINGHPKDSGIEQQIKKNEKTKVKWYPTLGKSNTLNAMIQDTDSDYIAILDADDVWFPTKLEKQVKLLENYNVIGTGCYYIQNGIKTNNSPKLPFGRVIDFKSFNPMINSSVIMKKSLAHWNPNTVIEDYDLWVTLFLQGHKFYNIPECLVYHRLHSKSYFNNGLNSNISAIVSRLD